MANKTLYRPYRIHKTQKPIIWYCFSFDSTVTFPFSNMKSDTNEMAVRVVFPVCETLKRVSYRIYVTSETCS